MAQSRRDFLKGAALTGLAVWAADGVWADDIPPSSGQSANDRVDFACIGVGGKGDSDTADAARLGNVVAICDVDDTILARQALKYPKARTFNDYRRMLDSMGNSIDAVTVSTPDHSHAPAAAMAMHLGKHCFCQKPLTHTLYEARQLAELARRQKVATQMGNQGTADSSMRKNAALVRAGALGTVKEIHVWTNRPIWPQGQPRPASAPVPPNLHWDLWLGPAPERPFAEGYHPFSWRGYWDFGSGALGDMACHTLNLPFMALDLRNPKSVLAQTSENNHDSYPKSSLIRYEFGGIRHRPALTLFWYDGGNLPPADLLPGQTFSDSGSLIVGDKGKLYTPGDYGGGGTLVGGVSVGEVKFPESPGHFEEFIRAIKGGPAAMSNFPEYAGPLTETVLLGNLAVWASGKKIEWDSRRLRAKNAPEVSSIIRPPYRSGYSL